MYFLPKLRQAFIVCLQTNSVYYSALSWFSTVKPPKLINSSAANEIQLRNYGPRNIK